MGIRGLARFLEAKQAWPVERTELPPNACLLIDGPGFLFYLCSQHVSFVDKLFAGDYSKLNQAIEAEVSWLRDGLGLDLIVFFDGPRATAHKQATSDKRSSRREEEWTNWQSYCRFPTNTVNTQLALPQIPTLAFTQFAHTLARLGVEQVYSEGEADLEIGFRIQLFNGEGQEPPVFFCYGKDSDYMAMQDCPYIEFGSLEREDEAGDDGEDVVTAPVITRRGLCEKLCVHEQALVELCLVLGNDFISDEAQFELQGKPIAGGAGAGVDTALAVLDAFKLDPLLKISSSTHETALDYSRRFYNLRTHEDMQRVCGEDKSAAAAAGATTVKDDDRFLTAQEAEWLDASSPSSPQDVFPSFWQLLRHIQLKQKATPGAFAALTIAHLYALSQMQSALATHKAQPLLDAFAVASSFPTPEWPDVVAGQVWQTICRRLYRANRLALEPAQVFHGQLYHHYLVLARQHEAPAAAPGGAYMTTASLRGQPAQLVQQQPRARQTFNPDELLPIDAKRDEILQCVHDNQVTLICGETGCGKSTKVCLYLVQQAKQQRRRVKMLISQPTRIAVQALMNRMRQTLGRRVGMRMGNGTVDEFPETDVWFVTTGYLVQRLAGLTNVDEFSHIIIDEMHERSTQADLAVLLAKKLVAERESQTKLVLMSATANINLYHSYFETANLSVSGLFVGAKRFENQIYYVDSLPGDVPAHLTNALSHSLSVGPKTSEDQCKLVVHLVRNGGIPLGSGVLVFVSGLSDIEQLFEELEPFAPRVVLFAIHSQLSEEFNHDLFLPCQPDQVKVIVATNAAQSSITIPDVDFVFDLGTHKSMQYQQRTHTSLLVESWISQSSAVQRAGRTGRVKPGVVFRLYAQRVFETEFPQHDPAEILESPLDDTIVSLRSTFEHHDTFAGVRPILEEMLESPDLRCIQNSFNSLHRQNIISHPSDEGQLTTCGRFVGRLSLGATLGRAIALGVCFGLGWEMTVVASALSQPKPCFRITHQLLHSPEENCEILRDNLLSILKLDCGYLSEPIMMLQIYKLFSRSTPSSTTSSGDGGEDQAINLAGSATERLVRALSMSHDRVKRFVRSTQFLLRSVGKLVRDPDFASAAAGGDMALSQDKLTRLRLLLTWTSSGRVLQLVSAVPPSKKKKKKNQSSPTPSPTPEQGDGDVTLSFDLRQIPAASGLLARLPVRAWFPLTDEAWEFTLPARVFQGELPPTDSSPSPQGICALLHAQMRCPTLVLVENDEDEEDVMFFAGDAAQLAEVFGPEDASKFTLVHGGANGVWHALPSDLAEDNGPQECINTLMSEFGSTTGEHGTRSCAIAVLQAGSGWLELALHNVGEDPARDEPVVQALWGSNAPKVSKQAAGRVGGGVVKAARLTMPSRSVTCQLLRTYLNRNELRLTVNAATKDLAKLPLLDAGNGFSGGPFPKWRTVNVEQERSVFKLAKGGMADGDEGFGDEYGNGGESYWDDYDSVDGEDGGDGLVKMASRLIISKPSIAASFPGNASGQDTYAIVSRSMEIGTGMNKNAATTVAEFVSIMPDAERFLPLALACVGWRAQTTQFKQLSREAKAGCELLKQDLVRVLCDEETIEPHAALWELVDQVFGSSSSTDAAVAATVVDPETERQCAQLEDFVRKVTSGKLQPQSAKKVGPSTPGASRSPAPAAAATPSKKATPVSKHKTQQPPPGKSPSPVPPATTPKAAATPKPATTPKPAATPKPVAPATPVTMPAVGAASTPSSAAAAGSAGKTKKVAVRPSQQHKQTPPSTQPQQPQQPPAAKNDPVDALISMLMRGL